VSNLRSTIAIAAGALVDSDLLWEEMRATGRGRVLVDRAATMLEPRHREAEETDPQMQWGSTKEGIGAARMDRIHRTAVTADGWLGGGVLYAPDRSSEAVATDVATVARDTLAWGGTVLVEAAQGYGLGLHTKYYPKTTSADCRAIDALADVGLSPWSPEIKDADLQIWVVVRPYPIRVAGESGPLAGETSWEDLGLNEERTTVTNKVRRVGTWDETLVRDAVTANGGDPENRGAHPVRVALTMVDQIIPRLAGWTGYGNTHTDEDLAELANWMLTVSACGAPVDMITTSPTTAVFDTDSSRFMSLLASAMVRPDDGEAAAFGEVSG
jgi:adenylosuccinate synthase